MSESEDSGYQGDGWIQWFCSLDDHHFFCQIDVDYIKDSFNLYGLKKTFSHYDSALNMIIDPESPGDDDMENQNFLNIYQEAMDLYGLIHARYIVSPKGLAQMKEKYLNGIFGVCPRVLCAGQFVLPISISEHLRHSRVKVYCPRCEDVFIPKKKCSDIDGAYFGCSFPHILLQSYPELIIKEPLLLYTPRIYGFKLYQKKGSKYAQKEENPIYNTYYEEKLKKLNNQIELTIIQTIVIN